MLNTDKQFLITTPDNTYLILAIIEHFLRGLCKRNVKWIILIYLKLSPMCTQFLVRTKLCSGGIKLHPDPSLCAISNFYNCYQIIFMIICQRLILVILVITIILITYYFGSDALFFLFICFYLRPTMLVLTLQRLRKPRTFIMKLNRN